MYRGRTKVSTEYLIIISLTPGNAVGLFSSGPMKLADEIKVGAVAKDIAPRLYNSGRGVFANIHSIVRPCNCWAPNRAMIGIVTET